MGEVAVEPAVTLLERERELAAIDRCLDLARAGSGRLLFIEGEAGTGKTALLRVAAQTATARGMNVLRARGSESEQSFAYGVVRQMYERPLAKASPRERRSLLEGAAGLAVPLLRPQASGDDTPPAPPLDAFVSLHGLYWLTSNLAERGPLLFAVDDMHWADAASVRFVAYLTARLEDLPILLVVTARPGTAGYTAVAGTATPPAAALHLGELSLEAVTALVREAVSAKADEGFCNACHEVTKGNPFLIHELLAAIKTDAIEPTAEQAIRVASLRPQTVAHAVLARLARLSPAAQRLARAVAILGPGAEVRLAARMAQLEPAVAAQAADDLRSHNLFTGDPGLEFVHPLIASFVYDGLQPSQRALSHARAAHILADDRADVSRVAGHLLLAEPAGDDWVVQMLVDAATKSVADGAPDAAVAFLRRALAEPCLTELRPNLLHQLGAAELSCQDPQALDHLRESLEATEEARPRAIVAASLAMGLLLVDDPATAMSVLTTAIEELGGTDVELEWMLEAQLLGAAYQEQSARDLYEARVADVRRLQIGDSPAGRMLLAMLCSDAVRNLQPAKVVRELGVRAWADGKLIDEVGPESPLFFYAVDAALITDSLDLASTYLDVAVARAQRNGSAVGFANASAVRSDAYFRRGRLVEAEADARAALEVAPESWALKPITAGLFLGQVLIERGQLDEAELWVLSSADRPDRIATLINQSLSYARGRLRIAQGRLQDGVQDLLNCGAWYEALGFRNPGLLAWRSSIAPALTQMGKHDQALELARDEVEIVRNLGQPRALGIALRAGGLVTGGVAGLELLEEALATLEGSGARLEHARALVDFGALMRRCGHPADARSPLQSGLDLAQRCGATELVKRAYDELIAAGARPRRNLISGVDSLTASERRVAQMAADGMSNREIAQSLFLSMKTVAYHLSHVYGKLEITGRDQLARVLASGDSSAGGLGAD
jgi:DNA-binding CsgD family transcriptional regulator